MKTPREHLRGAVETALFFALLPALAVALVVAAIVQDFAVALAAMDVPRRLALAVVPSSRVNPGEPDPRD